MRLEEIRKQRGLTRIQVSEATGISKDAIISYEKDEEKLRNAWIGNILKIANLFNISVYDLIPLKDYESEVKERIEEWDKKEIPDSFDVINLKYYNRVKCWQSRGQITSSESDMLINNLKRKQADYIAYVKQDGLLDKKNEKDFTKELNEIIIEFSPFFNKKETVGASGGERLRQIRFLKNVSLEKLAFCIGIKRQALNSYEKGKRNINNTSACVAIKMAIVLECELKDLFVI